jgi:predicted phosphodiesterase
MTMTTDAVTNDPAMTDAVMTDAAMTDAAMTDAPTPDSSTLAATDAHAELRPAPSESATTARRPTRFWVLSDLHQEFQDSGKMDVFRWTPDLSSVPEHDAIILAGDIHAPLSKSIAFAERLGEKGGGKPVFLVAGNHEFYGTVMMEELALARTLAAQTRHVTFLDNDAVTFNGVRIIGCTLWTDFRLFGDEWRLTAMQAVELGMNDYRRIKRIGETSGRTRPIRTMDTMALHHASRSFLETELTKWRDEEDRKAAQRLVIAGSGGGDGDGHNDNSGITRTPMVVITHHAPVRAGLAPQFQDDWISAGYASNLNALIEAYAPDLWVFGHTHYGQDTRIEARTAGALDGIPRSTRLLSNPRGYEGSDRYNDRFNPGMVVVV